LAKAESWSSDRSSST